MIFYVNYWFDIIFRFIYFYFYFHTNTISHAFCIPANMAKKNQKVYFATRKIIIEEANEVRSWFWRETSILWPKSRLLHSNVRKKKAVKFSSLSYTRCLVFKGPSLTLFSKLFGLLFFVSFLSLGLPSFRTSNKALKQWQWT